MTADRIAYCAPGTKLAASLALLLQGEQVAELTEHPWLEGSTDVLVVSPPDFSDIGPMPVLAEREPFCRLCHGITRHTLVCPLNMPLITRPGPVITLANLG